MKISVDDGKYEFVLSEGDWRPHILRYGEEWVTVELGCNAVVALMYELNAAREEISKLNQKIRDTETRAQPGDWGYPWV